jgi:hypothetical protein
MPIALVNVHIGLYLQLVDGSKTVKLSVFVLAAMGVNLAIKLNTSGQIT